MDERRKKEKERGLRLDNLRPGKYHTTQRSNYSAAMGGNKVTGWKFKQKQ